MSKDREQQLIHGRTLAEKGQLDDAWDIAEKHLTHDPNDGLALVLATFIMERAKRLPIAYHLAKNAAALVPGRSVPWTNLGRCAMDLWLMDEAETAFRKAVMLSETDQLRGSNLTNIAAVLIESGRFKDAEAPAREAVRLLPDNIKANSNLGFSLLGQKKFEGWDYYSTSVGTENRPDLKYSDEPRWEGEKDQKLLVYGEQGLGDEIMFSSMIPDAARDSKQLVFECTGKLAGLFRRSFPDVAVYGTRWTKNRPWKDEHKHPQASCSSGELGKFYRRDVASFPGTPFLKADPQRSLMWRALFDSIKKPVIGIAWTGGIHHTGEKFRTLTLEQLHPLFKSVDAHWVSLQYKDAAREIKEYRELHKDVDLVQYPFATLTPDYDDTAALVAECDLVICMQTAVAHLAGGLGKRCIVLLPKRSQWRYGTEGTTSPWYSSVEIYRQGGDWTQTIHKVADAIGYGNSDGHLSERRPAVQAA